MVMNEHTLRITIWAVMSIASSGIFWLVYRNELKRNLDGLLSAREEFYKAGGTESFLSINGFHDNVCHKEIDEAKEIVLIWQNRLNTNLRHRKNCMLACPAIMAIIALIYL